MVRANAAALLIVLAVVVLALAAVASALRAAQNARAARDSAEKLWQAYPAQARASRFGGALGRKAKSLEAVATAAQIRPSLELRNEAIATLALFDLEETEAFRRLGSGTQIVGFSSDLAEYTVLEQDKLEDFNTRTGSQVRTTVLPRKGIKPLARSAHGRYLALLSDGDLMVWDRGNDTIAFSLDRASLGERGWAFDFSSDERRFAVSFAQRVVRIIDLGNIANVTDWEVEGAIDDISLHPSEPVIALVRDRNVEIWNWERKELLQKLSHPAHVDRIVWRLDGKQLTTTCGPTLHLWNLSAGTERTIAEHSSFVSAVTYNHSGTLLVSTSYDGTTRFWEPYTGRSLLTTHRGFSVQISEDDTQLAFTRHDQFGVGLWRIAPPQGARLVHLEEPSSGVSVAFAPNGQWLALMAENGLHLFAVDTRPIHEVFSTKVAGGRSVHFSPDGRALITSGTSGIFIWPIEGGGSGEKFKLGPPAQVPSPKADYIEYSELTPDGKKLVVDLGRDAAVINLDNPAEAVVCSDKGYNNLSAVAISPDHSVIVSGTFHGSGTRIWDARTGKPIRNLDSASASVTFSPDGKWLVTGSGREYEMWDTSTWESKRRIARDTPDVLTGSAAFSRDGKLLALAQTQRLIKLLDVGSGEEIAALQSPDPQFINMLAFSPDGSLIAAATSGLGLQAWDLSELRLALGKLNLDWQNGPNPPGGAPFSIPPQSQLVIASVLGGVLLAVSSAFFVLRRHRRLLEAYQETEMQMTRRNRELELAKVEIMHSQKMRALGTLAAGIAHDFNNLLSVIRMSNQLIRRTGSDDPEIQESGKEIEHAVQQGKRVVSSMLGYSRDETDSGQPFPVAEVVEDTVSLLNKQFLSAITLTLELAPDARQVNVSRGRLEQALLNLVVNAAEAMDGSGSLRLSVRNMEVPANKGAVLQPRSATHYVELAVSDSGPGIAPEILDQIFEPFFTTKNTGTAHGTGLGLSLVYSIAEQDGLGLIVETAPGSGATFRLVIPAL